MDVVLLAAGLGSRLGVLTKDLPKALIPVAGKPLLAYALDFAARLAPSRVLVVGGFCFPKVRKSLADLVSTSDFPPVELIENPNFRDGNLRSLMAARPRLDRGFLVMNVDHIYRPGIADLVRPEVSAITAFIDTDRKLGADDMKVERGADGRIVAIAKTLQRFDCGYVGMTRVPTELAGRYFDEAANALAEEGRALHVERVLGRLARTEHAPVCRDISGHGWLEVDLPEERSAAEVVLASGAWA